MKPFAFLGKVQASKSILNRLLLVQDYAKAQIQISGDSDCDDVRLMRSALAQLAQNQTINAGSAGTVLRFIAVRASRIPGRHRIEGTARLLSRPQDELQKVFRQLGVQCTLLPDAIEIEGQDWRPQGDTLMVPANRSSQFLSAVLLNAWDLPFDLYVSAGGKRVSEGYFQMSLRVVERLGMRIDFWDGDFRIPKGQKPIGGEHSAEIDMGSAFALAAVAAVNGSATLMDFPLESLQPDAIFPKILESMGVPVHRQGALLKVEKAKTLNGILFEMDRAPDLFPVLAALTALANGPSHLYGGPQLVHKESDRVAQMANLLRAVGREVEAQPDGLKILGEKPAQLHSEKIIFDCDQDHRLAFAAAVLMHAGFNIEVRSPEVVKKSFPEFWSLVGWNH